MSVRSNGSYIGPRPPGPSESVASGIWDLRTAERQQRAAAWPVFLEVDPNFSDVVLLLHMDGSDGSTTFTDSSSYSRSTSSVAGDAQIDTAQSKFGGASALFNGVFSGSGFTEVADAIAFADSADFSMGSSDWTMEAWVRQTDNSENMELVSQRDGSSNQPFWFWRVNTSGTIRFYYLNSGGSVITDFTTTETITLNTWHHVAVVRASGSISIYVDGVSSGSGTNLSTAYGDAGAQVVIGAGGDSASANGIGSPYVGYIDDLRWTIGTARYTANFTPPTARFPDS